MLDKYKHGTGQYRLNYAKQAAAGILENVNRIETIWQLSRNGILNEEDADAMIRNSIEETEMVWETLNGYLKYREDLSK